MSEISQFIRDNPNGSKPEIESFLKRAKREIPEIQKIREGIRMREAEKKAAYVKITQEPESENEILRDYLASLLPAQVEKLKWVVLKGNYDKLIDYQEKIEERSGVWLRPAVFLRVLGPEYLPEEVES